MNSKINTNCSILKYLAQVLSQFNENRMKCEKEFQQWRETMDSICLALVVVERWKIVATLLPWHTMGQKTFKKSPLMFCKLKVFLMIDFVNTYVLLLILMLGS